MIKILIVDDEEINLDLLEEYLGDEGFLTVRAENGEDAWKKLMENSDISLILLDRMMPKLDGMGFMSRLYCDATYKNLPVIMQTAIADNKSMIEGINAGVYYYLAKPFKKDILLSVVHAAINDARYKKDLIKEVKNSKDTISLLKEALFEFKTAEQAQNIAYCLANAYPEPEKVILGLSEMLINAVEHGNLGIGYEEKGDLLMCGELSKEIIRRQNLPENKNKKVIAFFKNKDNEITINVKDEGNGFEWDRFMELHPERADRPNGRGIMMARMLSFDDIQYKNGGSEVTCKVLMRTRKSNVA